MEVAQSLPVNGSHAAENEWLTRTSSHYDTMAPLWSFTTRLARGTYIYPAHVKTYLHRREMGEHPKMYSDRLANLDPDLLFANALGRIVGQFFGNQSQLIIEWEREDSAGGLGDEEDAGGATSVPSRAYQLTTDTDGTGIGLRAWMVCLLQTLLEYEEVYVFVTRPTTDHGPVYWKIVEPDNVLDGDGETMVKVVHARTERGSLKDKPEVFVQVDLYDLDGMERWEYPKDKSKDAVQLDLGDAATYEYWRDATQSDRRLPLVHSSMKFRANMAYLAARKATAIMNKESERDNIFRTANTPRSIHKKDPMAGDAVAPLAEQIKAGANHLTISKEEEFIYSAPDTAPGLATGEVVKDKREAFFIAIYQQYNQEAAQQTATEIRQMEAGARIPILTLLAMRFDDVIRQCLLLTEQIEYPDAPGMWGIATANRQGKFVPEETEAESERDAVVFFPNGVPLTRGAYTDALRDQYTARGIPIDDDDAFVLDAEDLWRLERFRQFTEAGVIPEEAAKRVGYDPSVVGSMTRQDRTDLEQ